MPTKIYRSTDAGAPNGASLIGVLDALVTGYGTKPALGITKVYSGTNKGVYRLPAGSSQRYLRVDETFGTNESRMTGYQAMTDVDTGTGAFPSESAVPGGLRIYRGGVNAVWHVISDGKYMHILWNVSNQISYYCFGDLLPLNTGGAVAGFIHGSPQLQGNSAFETLATTNASNTPAPGSFIHQSFTQIGSGVGAMKVSDTEAGGNLGVGWGAIPNYDGPIVTAALRINEAGGSAPQRRGIVPGLQVPLFNATQFNQGDIYTNAANGRTYEFWRWGGYGVFIETSNWI